MLPLQMFWTTWPLPAVYVSVLREFASVAGVILLAVMFRRDLRTWGRGKHWSSERFEPRALGVRAYEMIQRLGSLDLAFILDRDGVHAAVGQPPVLHRSCQKMQEWLVAADSIVLTEFDRGPARPCNGGSTAASFDSV